MDTVNWHERFIIQSSWTSSIRHYIYKIIGVETCTAILEVGCGTGVISSEIHNFTSAKVTGVDTNQLLLQKASEFDKMNFYAAADAMNLPFEGDSFELVFSHFLLLWLNQPVAALREMKRVVRRGGYVIAMAEPDFNARIDYPLDLEEIGLLQTKSLGAQGVNTQIGRQLGKIFHDAGFSDIHTGLIGGEWQAGRPSYWESEWQTLSHDLNGICSQEKFNHLLEKDETAWRNGERILYVPTFYAWGLN
jgi:ubiquinone/menaquinone biosynthesis C-methylase UbiE